MEPTVVECLIYWLSTSLSISGSWERPEVSAGVAAWCTLSFLEGCLVSGVYVTICSRRCLILWRRYLSLLVPLAWKKQAQYSRPFHANQILPPLCPHLILTAMVRESISPLPHLIINTRSEAMTDAGTEDAEEVERMLGPSSSGEFNISSLPFINPLMQPPPRIIHARVEQWQATSESDYWDSIRSPSPTFSVASITSSVSTVKDLSELYDRHGAWLAGHPALPSITE